MNREKHVDETITRWVDEGPDTAPERFVWAAVEEVERRPQRGAWRASLENAHMFVKLGAPILAATAVIAVAVFAYQQFNWNNVGNDVSSPSPTASLSADLCAGDNVSVVAPDTLAFVWCVIRDVDTTVVTRFTMEAPVEWADQDYSGGRTLYLRPAGGGAIVFALGDVETAAEWVEQLQGLEGYELSDPAPITFDGAAGFVLDAALADGVSTGTAPPLIDDTDLAWEVSVGSTSRIWIVDRGGGAIAFATKSPDAEFEAWATEVGDALQTIVWSTDGPDSPQ